MEVEKRMALMPRNTYTHNSLTSAAIAGGRATETIQQQPPPPPLKCPRCESSNTKFCYYNNYSLSQPRHFCKACKRYWTRGGTLRNVPVGGGCRKNKRVKRSSSSMASSTVAGAAMVSKPPSIPLNISDLPLPLSSSTAIDHHPIFYGLQQRNGSDHFGLNSIGLCFPSNQDLGLSTLQFHPEDSTPSTSLLHDYSLIGSSLSSFLRHQTLMDYNDIQPAVMAGGGNLGGFREVKDENGRSTTTTTTTINGLNHININGLDWEINSQLENLGSLGGNSLCWNFNSTGNPNH